VVYYEFEHTNWLSTGESAVANLEFACLAPAKLLIVQERKSTAPPQIPAPKRT